MPGAHNDISMAKPLTLIRGARLVLPDRIESTDLLIANGQIAALGDAASQAATLDLTEIHGATGLTVSPGLIDAHMHFLGGGGGDGFGSRIPELSLTDLTMNGITTAVGAPGIDMVSRNADGLLAKARGFTEDGVTAFIYVGGFHRPMRTVTGSVWRDAYIVPEVIGVKVAVGESRAPSISNEELVDLARELLWVGRATGRGGVLHIHLGLDPEGKRQLLAIASRVPDPSRVVITHANYSADTLAAAIELASAGLRLDVTTMLAPERGVTGAVPPAEAVRVLLDAGIDPSQLSMSTDGNGSAPKATEGGGWEPYRTHMDSLLTEVRTLAALGDLAVALRLVTANPARALGLDAKGQIAVGADADLVALDVNLELVHTYARGRRLVASGEPIVPGRFDNKVRPRGRGKEAD
jgi:beta-aspartyl-dipeptidase (metallo-type)